MLRPLITSLIFLGSSLGVAFAQANATPSDAFTLRLLAFSPELKQKEVFIQDPVAPDAAPVPSEIKSYLNDQNTSVPLKSRKVAFTLKRERTSLNTEGEFLGEVTIPEKTRSLICLFLPGKKGDKARFQIMPISDTKADFPVGCFHVTNLSPLPVRIQLENKPYDFKPGQVVIIQNPPVRDGGQSGMRTFAFKNNQWQPVSAGIWSSAGRGRKLMILYANPVNGNIQLNAFDDVPPV